MIRGYFGLPGAGKSYLMTKDALRSGRGRTVYANYHVDIPDAKEVILLESPMEFIKVSNGLLLIDEAGLWLPSFIWQAIPREIIWKLAQIRKFGIDLYYTAQNPARVVKPLREITYESVFMEKFFRLFIARYTNGIDDGDIARQLYFYKQSIADHYDTLEMVGVI